MKVLVTGGAGFIGSAVVRHIIENTSDEVRVIDCLTYAGNLESLAPVAGNEHYSFSQTDITDAKSVAEQFSDFRPDIVMHLAAESHVDRSIDGPAAFIQTNLIGTFTLLEAARQYWSALDMAQKQTFRFHHISTDEVYGDLHGTDDLFTEETPYAPSSPYSASKAGSDHLVRAWNRTYGLPVVVTNCSNNYGPYHFPEKLIPLMISRALADEELPVYGNGENVRDWLHVSDHCEAIDLIIHKGKVGEIYNIGGHNERTNLEVVKTILKALNKPESLIKFVTDRPGHDRRYAIDPTKIETELGWKPKYNFDTGIQQTIQWYLDNQEWWKNILSGEYSNYFDKMYGNRL